MTEPSEREVPDDKAAQAAIAEVNADDMPIKFGEFVYTVSRSAVSSIQYVLLLQKGSDVIAMQYLLGGEQFGKFISDHADDKGNAPRRLVWDFLNAAGKELGTGNQ